MPLWGRAPRARLNELNEFSEFRKLRRKRVSVPRSDTPLRGAADFKCYYIGIIWYARIVGTLGMAVDRVHLIFK